eukprot:PhF_6_TR867/c0_g1_i2/m.1305
MNSTANITTVPVFQKTFLNTGSGLHSYNNRSNGPFTCHDVKRPTACSIPLERGSSLERFCTPTCLSRYRDRTCHSCRTLTYCCPPEHTCSEGYCQAPGSVIMIHVLMTLSFFTVTTLLIAFRNSHPNVLTALVGAVILIVLIMSGN